MDTEGSIRRRGTVDWFSEHKGYGYLTADDGTAVYCHHAQIRGEGFRTLPPGAEVSFVLGDDGRGPAAEDIALLAEEAGATPDRG